MNLLCVLVSLPVFMHQFTGDGEIVARGCIEKTDGYFAVCTKRNYPGGLPESFVVYMDEEGTGTLSYTVGSGLEAMQLCPFGGKKAILARRPALNYTTVFQIGGADVLTVFQDQFMETAVMAPRGNEMIIAGNDFPGDPSVRIAVLDTGMEVVSNEQYPGLNMMVADVSTVDGETCVLGSTEQSGWQRDMTLFFPGTSDEYHFQPLPGRFEPVELLPLDDGCMVVANSITEENGMIGEIFLMKLASDMSVVWTVSLGGGSWLNAVAADLTGEGVVLTGWTNDLPLSESNRSDLIIAEFSAEGELLWTREYGGDTTDYGLEIETCLDGGFLVSGCYGAGYYDGLLLRTDSMGTLDGMGLQEEAETTPVVSVLSNPSCGNEIVVCIPDWINGAVEVSVLDMTGRCVRSTTALTGNVTFSALPTGVYMVLAASGDETASARVVVTGGDR